MYNEPIPSDATSWLIKLDGGLEGASCRITDCFDAGWLLLMVSWEFLQGKGESARYSSDEENVAHLKFEW